MIILRLLGMVVLAMAFSTQLGNGCVADSGGGNSGPPDNSSPDYGRPNRIPRNADVVSESTEKLRWVADLNGRCFVYDVQRDRIVYDCEIRRGQVIYVDASHDKVYLDQKEVYDRGRKAEGLHRVYFAPERQSGGGSDGVPSAATELAEGKGNLAINESPGDGTLFVYDNSARRVVYQTNIRRGNSFQIFLKGNYVNVNSRKVADVRFDNDARHTLYFKRK